MIVEGIAFWAQVNKPDPGGVRQKKNGGNFTAKCEYKINLLLDADTAKELHSQKFNVKIVRSEIPGIPDAVGRPYIVAKKPGEFKAPIRVDAQLNAYDGLIGNGSKVKVQLDPFEYEVKTGQADLEGNYPKAISAQLLGVQIIDLVEFKKSGNGERAVNLEFSKEKGFTADKDSGSAGQFTKHELKDGSDDAWS